MEMKRGREEERKKSIEKKFQLKNSIQDDRNTQHIRTTTAWPS